VFFSPIVTSDQKVYSIIGNGLNPAGNTWMDFDHPGEMSPEKDCWL